MESRLHSLEVLKKLKSETDIRGIAIKTPEYEVNLTPEIVRLIGYGFIKWIENKGNNSQIKIAIGMDSRLSGTELKTALIETLINNGCTAYDCTMATTPSMFMATVLDEYKCTGAIMITASHLPYYYNGLKFFTSNGGCEKEDIDEILTLSCDENVNAEKSLKGTVKKVNLLNDYSNILIDKVRKAVASKDDYEKPLKGSKIIVDAGNGAGGFFAEKVLKELGANVEGSQFLEPDGRFPNHIPNPENKEAMESIKNAVLKNKADLGIIFDTDVDRAAIVDGSGREVNKNALIALIASIILEEHPKSIVVTDSVTSTGLTEFITSLGGVHHRFKRGYKNVINEAKRLNAEGLKSYLAIETSGHAALKENYFLDDGAYLIAKILVKMAKLNLDGKKVESLIKNLKTPIESNDFRLKIKTEDYRGYGNLVLKDLENYVKGLQGFSIVKNNYEGIRVNCDNNNGDGWLLLRLSLHEPLLALNIESDLEGGTQIIIKRLLPFLEKYEKIDINVLLN